MGNERGDCKAHYLSVYLSGEIWDKLETLKQEKQILSYAGFVRECIEIILKAWENENE